MKKTARLEDWSLRIDTGGFLPPEQGVPKLDGIVFGHPNKARHFDGKGIVTSRIVSTAGRYVTTASGTVYRLGRINRKYRDWIRLQGLNYDPKQPVKIHQRQDTH